MHPQTNRQAKRANQSLITSLQSTGSSQLPWAEYAHNPLPSSSSGLSPFECLYGYQPPCFPLTRQRVSFLDHQLRRCHWTWRWVRTALLQTSQCYQWQANLHRTPHQPTSLAKRYGYPLATFLSKPPLANSPQDSSASSPRSSTQSQSI